jgi:hypothetical protein
MSNNPVSFVDPDGGWDDWYNRSGVSYFVDGMQLDDWEFKNYLNNPSHGDAISYSGGLFAGTILLRGWKAVKFFINHCI